MTKLERLDALERRVGALERQVRERPPTLTTKPQTDAQALRNLAALNEWCDPRRWGVGANPAEAARIKTMLDHFAALIQIAASGGDVPRP